VFHPSPDWEYPLVHLIVFLISLFTIGCYDFLLQSGLRRPLAVRGFSRSKPVCRKVWRKSRFTGGMDIRMMLQVEPAWRAGHWISADCILRCGLLVWRSEREPSDGQGY
jgi:hypothetical protein